MHTTRHKYLSGRRHALLLFFVPTRMVLLIIAGLLLIAVVTFLLIRLVRRRVNNAVRQSSELGQMMEQVLNMGDYFVVEWDFRSNMLHNKYGNMLPTATWPPRSFSRAWLPRRPSSYMPSTPS